MSLSEKVKQVRRGNRPGRARHRGDGSGDQHQEHDELREMEVGRLGLVDDVDEVLRRRVVGEMRERAEAVGIDEAAGRRDRAATLVANARDPIVARATRPIGPQRSGNSNTRTNAN